MSKKSTKIIAAAGVVAGLGVAALPAMTFATETVSGGVNVRAVVNEAIAMTIQGNDDDVLIDNGGTGDITGDSTYTPSDSSKINSYDTANGIAYNGTSFPTNVQFSSGSKVELLPNTLVNGTSTASQPGTGFSSLIKVWTNSAVGYDITLKDEDATTALVYNNGTSDVDTIAAVAAGGDLNTGLGAGNGAWGFKVGTASSDGTGYTAVPASTGAAASIKSNGSAFADGEETTVYYGVATKAAQKSGTYTDKIIYTATTKNAGN